MEAEQYGFGREEHQVLAQHNMTRKTCTISPRGHIKTASYGR
jgi:hypothetical protein